MTTNNRDNQFWKEMATEMQDAMHLRPLSEDEAAHEYEQATNFSFSEADIHECFAIAKSGIPHEPSYAERIDDSPSFSEIDTEVGEIIALHRNEGEFDAEVEELMRRKREEALDDEDTDDEGESET